MPLCTALLDDSCHVLKEAHVKHSIGLIEHERLHSSQVKRTTVDVIQNSSRRAHHHMSAMEQTLSLSPERHATTQGDDFDVVQRTRKSSDFSRHLIGQFPGWTKHERLNIHARCFQSIDQRQSKSHGLAASRARLCDQVTTRQSEWQGESLNGCHLSEPHLLQVVQSSFGQRQGVKAQRLVLLWTFCVQAHIG